MKLLPTLSLLTLGAIARAEQVLIMPDSSTTTPNLVAFSPVDGSLINAAVFAFTGGNTVPNSAIQVGNEVWTSEQVGDKVTRYDWTGNVLGTSAAGELDNCRGMTKIGDLVYVANSGTTGGAPGAAIVTYNLDGSHADILPLAFTTSPYYVLSHEGSLLVASANANDDIHRYTTLGATIGTFVNGTTTNFAEQMNPGANDTILVAWFSSNKVSTFDTAGVELGNFTASGVRGVYQLQNGNILWSSGTGVRVYDVALQTSTQVYTGQGRFFSLADMPTQTLSGDLELSDTSISFASNRSISYQVKQGATVLSSGTITASSKNTSLGITVPASASGSAKLVLNGSAFLQRVVTLNLTGSNQSLGSVVMANGDADDDGEVGLNDIDLIITNYGLDTASADLDVDGEVGLNDIDIAIAHYGEGDESE